MKIKNLKNNDILNENYHEVICKNTDYDRICNCKAGYELKFKEGAKISNLFTLSLISVSPNKMYPSISFEF